MLIFRTSPAVDYLTFYKTAQMLAESWTIDFNYVTFFPHIMGYASFLSIFFILFGDSQLVAPIVNVIVSTVSMVLIYYIAYKLYDHKAAWIASILWIVYPSQTIYNALVLSEPLYTMLILAFWALFLWKWERISVYSWGKIGWFALIASLLLMGINATRPMAIILYIALAIWVLLGMNWKNRSLLWRKVSLLALIGIFFMVGGLATTVYNTSRLGAEIATTAGYNLYVGFNEESRGKWNEEDSKRLFQYVSDHSEWTAYDAQKQMLQDAKTRILHGNIHFASLFYDKIHLLWGDDAMAYKYSDIKHNQTSFHAGSNAFYYFTMLFSILGVAVIRKKDRNSAALMLCLFVLGLTCAHLIAEVAARYHYSGTAVFAILAGVGVVGMRFKKVNFEG